MISEDRRTRQLEKEDIVFDPELLEELEEFWAKRYEEEYL